MRADLHSNDMAVLAVGIIVAFVSALIVIRALIRYVSKDDFTAFAYYRIGFGLFILATWWTRLGFLVMHLFTEAQFQDTSTAVFCCCAFFTWCAV